MAQALNIVEVEFSLREAGHCRPSTIHIRCCVLSLTHASSSTPTDGPAVCLFSHINPSASVPAADPLLSIAPVPMFLCFLATSPRHMFAPSSAPGPGLAYAQIAFQSTFQAEIVPRNT